MQASTTQPEFQVSDDGYWQLVDGNWVPTELQNEAIAKGAIPHVSNLGVNTIPQTAEQVVFHSLSSNRGVDKKWIVIGVVAVGILVTVVLANVLYWWASSLAEDQDPNLVGDWTNPSDKLELESNGDAKESSGTFESWYTADENLYFEDEDYSYKFRYSLVEDILSLAPYSEDGDLIEEDCIAYLQGLSGESESYFNNEIENAESNGTFPSWCNPS
jgi:hypothetical protein